MYIHIMRAVKKSQEATAGHEGSDLQPGMGPTDINDRTHKKETNMYYCQLATLNTLDSLTKARIPK